MPSVKKDFILAISSLAVFLTITLSISGGIFIDPVIYKLFDTVGNSSLYSFAKNFSLVTEPEIIFFVLLILIVLLLFKKKIIPALFISILTITNFASVYILKEFIGRGRPSGFDVSMNSFPSGHVMAMMVLGFALYYIFNFFLVPFPKNILVWIFSLLILVSAVSRLTLGAHFASDVLASCFLALFWYFAAKLCIVFIYPVRDRRSKYIA